MTNRRILNLGMIWLFLLTFATHKSPPPAVAETCQTFSVTAYNWTGYPAASGKYPFPGSVAVYSNPYTGIPRFPYGSVIWVEGFGNLVVNDTGGGLRWNDLDVYWGHDVAGARAWGRKPKTACPL